MAVDVLDLLPPPPESSPPWGCVAIGDLPMVVILNEVKNLINSTESSIKILRLSPQNDITTQPPWGEELVFWLNWGTRRFHRNENEEGIFFSGIQYFS
jgi:hypothetical protein